MDKKIVVYTHRMEWYIYTVMEYYLAVKRNTVESTELRWMNLEPATQSEVSQKDKYHTVAHSYGI